ncbi:drebrin-like protein [Sarotherodon galilaeus]
MLSLLFFCAREPNLSLEREMQQHISSLLTILNFMLQFEACISETYMDLYYTPGNDVILPCDNTSSSNSSCSIITWFYNRDNSETIEMVWNGAIMENSAQAARLSLYSNCSLGIRNIVAEDAGLYCCRSGNTTAQDINVGLHILNISASQTLNGDGYITLACTLFKYSDSQLCGENSILWLNERGTVLLGSGARDTGPMCVSLLTVKPQRAHNKTYTCQYIKKNSVKIEAHYTPRAVISGQMYHLYHRPGDSVTLPCDSLSDICTMINWLYSKDSSQTKILVQNSNVKQSAQAARLSLQSNCSLGIDNITAEDAGKYFCRPEGTTGQGTSVYLHILTISGSPSDTDPQKDGNITLECSLFRYYSSIPCKKKSICWVDETGFALPDRGVLQNGQTKCVSLLTFLNKKTVMIEGHYTPVFIASTNPLSDSTPNKGFILIGAGMVILVLVVIFTVFIKYSRRAKVTEDIQKPSHHNVTILKNTLENEKMKNKETHTGTWRTKSKQKGSIWPADLNSGSSCCEEEPEGNIIYATIDHSNQKTLKKKVKNEEAVTYSAVKTKAETDPSSIYSNIC